MTDAVFLRHRHERNRHQQNIRLKPNNPQHVLLGCNQTGPFFCRHSGDVIDVRGHGRQESKVTPSYTTRSPYLANFKSLRQSLLEQASRDHLEKCLLREIWAEHVRAMRQRAALGAARKTTSRISYSSLCGSGLNATLTVTI
jgi:hypothetical protein